VALLSATGGPLLRRIHRLALSRPGQSGSPVGAAALLAPLVTISLLFFAATHLVAMSVNVMPPRGLADVQSLSAQIYSVLDISPGSFSGGKRVDVLDALSHVINATTDNGKTFEAGALDRFVHAALGDSRPDALAEAQLPLVRVSDYLRSYERNAKLKYGTLALRLRLARHLLDRAAEQNQAEHPDVARDYARAAVLLAAQDADLNATLTLGRILRNDSLQRLAQLTPRQMVRLNRAVEDHRQVLEIGQREVARAKNALRALNLVPAVPDQDTAVDAHAPVPATRSAAASAVELDAARQDLMKSYSLLLRLSKGRPDIQLTAARLCWQSRSVLAGDDAAMQREKLRQLAAAFRSPYLERWVDEALQEAPPQIVPYPPIESPEMFRNRISN
jgi:hypothetical protein